MKKNRAVYSKLLSTANISDAESLKDDNLAIDQDYAVIGEGHPNGLMNTVWPACVLEHVEQHGL